jgi:Domain of unknown function (DUF2760)
MDPLPPTAPGIFARVWLAIVCLFRVIFDAQFARQVQAVRERSLPSGPTVEAAAAIGGALSATPIVPAPPQAAPALPQPTVSPQDQALHLLALLQREGRLIDFAEEDIAAYGDAEVGAAARTVHSGVRKVLRSYLQLAPVRAESEGADVSLPQGFDAVAVRVTGNVVGNPPFRGALRHHGWRASEVKLPPPPSGQDARILAPAEVELP